MENNNVPTITRCAARRGWLWWTEAFKLVRDAAGSWYGLGVAYCLMLTLPVTLISVLLVQTLTQLAPLGSLPMILIPCFVVGFIAAGWSQARGQKPEIHHLFAGFKSDVKTLLVIGAITVALSLIINSFVSPFSSPEYLALAQNIHTGENIEAFSALMFSSSFLLSLLLWGFLLSLLIMAAWLAPAVVVFQHTTAVPALLRSLKALCVNWRALSVYILAPIVVIICCSFILGVVSVIFSLAAASAGTLFATLIVLLVFTFIPWLVSVSTLTAFVAYCDIFHAQDHVFPRDFPQSRNA